MNISEFTDKVRKAITRHNIDQSTADDFAEYSYYGLRFEDKQRDIGEEVGNSRHNFEREDEREFPEYGTDEYEKMMELDGASAWYIDECGTDAWTQSYKGEWQTETDDLVVVTEHCYIIAGDVEGNHDDPDHNEIVIKDAVVVEQLF